MSFGVVKFCPLTRGEAPRPLPRKSGGEVEDRRQAGGYMKATRPLPAKPGAENCSPVRRSTITVSSVTMCFPVRISAGTVERRT